MKKILLGLVSAAALLTSCGSDGSSSGNGTVGNSLIIYQNSLQFTSNYIVKNFTGSVSNYQWTNYNGPVICDNTTTLLNFSFDYVGDLKQANVRMHGITTQTDSTLNVQATNWSGSHGSVDFYVGGGLAPLSLQAKAQSVVANPAVLGATTIQMEGVTSSGAVTNTIRSNVLPVLSNCS